jgi:N-hydroxyarylamine O-acetyltransferase
MALTELGFKCRANLARVHRNRPDPGGRSHQVNFVELDSQVWLCDVGFGGSGFRQPLRLQSDVEVEQMGEIYRLHETEVHGFYLEKKIAQAWYPLYIFKIDPALPIDMDMANFYTSNSPDYIFRNAIMGTKMTSCGRVTLLDHTFKCFDLTKGTMETITVSDYVTYLDTLREHLGVKLNESEQALLRTRFAMIKQPEH